MCRSWPCSWASAPGTPPQTPPSDTSSPGGPPPGAGLQSGQREGPVPAASCGPGTGRRGDLRAREGLGKRADSKVKGEGWYCHRDVSVWCAYVSVPICACDVCVGGC